MSLMTESYGTRLEAQGALSIWLGEHPCIVATFVFAGCLLAFWLSNGALLGLFIRFGIFALIGWLASSIASLATDRL